LTFLPRIARVFLVKTISSCFSTIISTSFFPRRLLRVDTGGSSSIDGGGDSTGGVIAFDFVLRPVRRFGEGG